MSKVWWANHSIHIKGDKMHDYIWAPLTGKDGLPLFHHVNVGKVSIGDIVLHYSDDKIRHVSRVISKPVIAFAEIKIVPQPEKSFATTPKHSDGKGYKAGCAYKELDSPIDIKDFGKKLIRPEIKYWPIDKNGRANQGFLYAIDVAALAIIWAAQPKAGWPPFVNDVIRTSKG